MPNASAALLGRLLEDALTSATTVENVAIALAVRANPRTPNAWEELSIQPAFCEFYRLLARTAIAATIDSLIATLCAEVAEACPKDALHHG